MCPHMIVTYDENNHNQIPICEQKNNLCTLCICGDAKTYKEIESEKIN